MANAKVILDLTELEHLIKREPQRVKKIVKATAFQAQGYMQDNSAVDTGAQKSGIHVKTNDYDGGREAIASVLEANPKAGIADFPAPTDGYTARVGPVTEYSIYQEFGTSKMAAHPFVVPGIELARREFETRWRELFI